jgi:hypothetical protein
MTHAIEAHGLTKRFGDTLALDNVDLQVGRGLLENHVGVPEGAPEPGRASTSSSIRASGSYDFQQLGTFGWGLRSARGATGGTPRRCRRRRPRTATLRRRLY